MNHTFSTGWYCDENEHWYACTKCGERQDVAAHEWQYDICVHCGLSKPEQKPTEPVVEETEPESTDPVTTDAPTTPSEETAGEESNKKDFPIWIPIVAVVVIGGAAGAFFVLKKKRS